MRRVALLATISLLSAGCADAADDGTITVFAASSLTDVFADLAAEYERSHPGREVDLVLAGSSRLVSQLVDGAPADVLATADTATMADAAATGALGERPVTFAENALAIAIPTDNPGDVSSLSDLAADGLVIAVCAEPVPCGAATAELLTANGVVLGPATQEANVRSVLAKVELGEVDAGIVYRTDVSAAGTRVRGVEIADDRNVVVGHQIALTARGARAAADFVALVTSDAGAAILSDHGFITR